MKAITNLMSKVFAFLIRLLFFYEVKKGCIVN